MKQRARLLRENAALRSQVAALEREVQELSSALAEAGSAMDKWADEVHRVRAYVRRLELQMHIESSLRRGVVP